MSGDGADRAGGVTRARLLDAAERLFAEHGLAAVSNRRVAEEAGQANNSAVGYHVGDRRDLVTAIVRRHAEPMDTHRAALVAASSGSAALRDRVACLVLPVTDHLAALGIPSWYARFSAAVTTDPPLRELVLWEGTASASMRTAIDGLLSHVPGVPADVVAARADMARHVIVHTCAETERALAEGGPSAAPSWGEVGERLVDAVVGLLTAPVTTRERTSS